MPTLSRRAGIVFVALLVFAVSTGGQGQRRTIVARGVRRTDAPFVEGPRRVYPSYLLR